MKEQAVEAAMAYLERLNEADYAVLEKLDASDKSAEGLRNEILYRNIALAALRPVKGNAKHYKSNDATVGGAFEGVGRPMNQTLDPREEGAVPKPILDVCCGGKMFYFDKNDPRVLFMDIREVEHTLCDGRKFEVAPDVVADFTRIPYNDNTFRMVVFDPPHLLYNTGKSKFADLYGSLNEKATPTGYQHIKYGALYGDWRDMLSQGFKECFRVLCDGGILIFKWNETDVKVREVLALTPEKPVFGHKSGKASKTHWICFMKAK